MNAIRTGLHRLVPVLVSYGASIHEENRHGISPVLMAAICADLESLQFLLQHRANAKARDHAGRTGLHYIAGGQWYTHMTNRITKCVCLLVEYGADPNAIDVEGNTPLSYAMDLNTRGMVNLLLKCGATQTGSKQKSVLQLARENKDDISAAVFRAFFHEARMRKLRGIIRFIIVSGRYREEFYCHKYAEIGARSFTLRNKQLRENSLPNCA